VKKRRKKPAPPTPYSDGVAAELCARMAAGESMPQICRDAHMPNRWTVYDWAKKKPEFLARFNEARERLCDYWADEIVAIADDSTKDYQGNGVLDEDHLTRARVRIDTRKWLLSKLKRATYGDSRLVRTQQLDVHGNPVDPPVIVIPYDEAEEISRGLDERV
jgi:hypothetical protein